MMQTQSAKQPLTHINLFSGYGGWDIALQQWLEQRTNQNLELRTVLYCEIESYCQQVIAQRQRDGLLSPEACIWDDVRTLNLEGFRGAIDILSASAPCQPFSVAGKQRQDQDERDMFPDTLRLISECRPRVVVLENVPGVISTGSGKRRPYIERVLCQLAELRYTDIRWEILSAKDVGAPHLRKRWLCIAKLENSSSRREWGEHRTTTGGTGSQDVRQKDRTVGSVRIEATDAKLDNSSSGRYWEQEEEVRPRRIGSVIPDRNLADSECERYATGEQQGRSRYEEGLPQRSGIQLEYPTRGRQQQCESLREEKEKLGSTGKPSDQELGNTNDSGDRASRLCNQPDRDREKEAQEGQDQSFPRVSRPVDNDNQELADTNNSGWRQDREQTQPRTSLPVEPSCNSGRTEQTQDEEERAWRWTNNRPGLPEFPPSPDDHESWEWIITNRPDLAPAVTEEIEQQICGIFDGTAGKLDKPKTYRTQRLKMLGNGVVPATLALFLSRHIQD